MAVVERGGGAIDSDREEEVLMVLVEREGEVLLVLIERGRSV